MSSASCLTVVSNFPAATFDRCRILRGARPYAVACVAISSRWRPDSVGWFVPRSPAAAQYLWPAGRARRAIPEGAGPLRLLGMLMPTWCTGLCTQFGNTTVEVGSGPDTLSEYRIRAPSSLHCTHSETYVAWALCRNIAMGSSETNFWDATTWQNLRRGCPSGTSRMWSVARRRSPFGKRFQSGRRVDE